MQFCQRMEPYVDGLHGALKPAQRTTVCLLVGCLCFLTFPARVRAEGGKIKMQTTLPKIPGGEHEHVSLVFPICVLFCVFVDMTNISDGRAHKEFEDCSVPVGRVLE